MPMRQGSFTSDHLVDFLALVELVIYQIKT